MYKALAITINPNEKGIIAFPSSVNLSANVKYVSFGTNSCECRTIQRDIHSIEISEDIFDTLKVPYKKSIQYFIHEETLFIGPLIGIFTAGFSNSMLRPIGERSLFFAKLLSTEKDVGAYVFVFGANHINWDNGTINGYFYKENGWVCHEVPFPNVIYDRLPNRRTEKHIKIKEIKDRLHDEYLIPWFNPGFFNKWEIHKELVKNKAVSRFLPETYQNITFSLIEEMLAKYQHVYVKPANGSLGLGIYQIIYNKEDEAYYCRYKDDNDEKRLQKYSSLEKLVNHLFRKKNLRDYIVQQGIHLIRIDHKAVDFRVHTNKDTNNEWQVSVIAAKISGRGSVTTHINSGGVVKTIQDIFPNETECETYKKALENASLLLSKKIEETQKGNLGELGFDLGIDKDGKVWLFEANSKPGRSIFSHPKLRKYDRLSNQLSLQYAIYLSEQSILNPEEVYQDG